MKQLRLSRLAVLIAAIGFAAAPELSNIAANTAYAQEAMRPEIGRTIQAAGELLKAKKYKDAMSKLHEADGVGGKTANESFTIERMRLSIASQSGDNDAVIRSAEAIIAANKLSGKDQLQHIQVLANAYYKAGNYSKAAQAYGRYFSEGGTDSTLRPYMIHAMSQGGDSGRAMKEVQADLAADEKAGRTPSLSNLEFYANAALKQKDTAGYANALEKLIAYHGKKEYWVNLLNNVERKPGYSERLSLDLYRLKLAVGQVTKTADFMDMSKLAVLGGYPAEALKIIDLGFKSGALGTGNEAERHNRLRVLAKKTLDENAKAQVANEVEANQSKDGTALANLGYAYVTAGQYDKGIAMLEQAITKNGMKYAEDAKLHLGLAYLQAGKKTNAIKILKSVQGADGTADLARYWVIYANQAVK
ncbi:MAG: tetratricopeptide repeat protein [Undibacterium sp.]|uniref:tetratricopeptide repeat protein n=1 Tax=Undibacterium sp. TaxID=1914977 RepID=UPI00271D13CD|nr:tetratricopeptide repeat protein [Undibacterium sp.]MDO8653275.1 tetratricopeptide repeat protein [Undibacterium sp.]